jgi:hypothetical protein
MVENLNNSKIIEENFKSITNLINKDQITEIRDEYNSKNIYDIYHDFDKLRDSKIGPLNPFKYYIQLKFCCEEKYENLGCFGSDDAGNDDCASTVW